MKKESKIEVDKQDRKAIRQMANRYWLLVKSRCIYAQPWRREEPFETQRIYTHFVKALKKARKLDADPIQFIDAQFRYYSQYDPKKYPYPSQLHSANATQRWHTYADEQAEYIRVHGHPVETSIKNDKHKYKALKLRYPDMSERELITFFCTEFSPAFLKSKELWNDLSEEWTAIMVDDPDDD